MFWDYSISYILRGYRCQKHHYFINYQKRKALLLSCHDTLSHYVCKTQLNFRAAKISEYVLELMKYVYCNISISIKKQAIQIV